ncbi:MAG TPA: DNA-directed RNA polymerase subunit omega [Pyrinomonadaceae bacterium]
MDGTNKTADNGFDNAANEEQWPGIDSRYRLIVVAALRAKQLLHGSPPRIEVDPLRRRNTSIALEEVKRGLINFRITDKDNNGGGGTGAPPRNHAAEESTGHEIEAKISEHYPD